MWRTGAILISALINRLHYSIMFSTHKTQSATGNIKSLGKKKTTLQKANNLQLLRNLLKSGFHFAKWQAAVKNGKPRIWATFPADSNVSSSISGLCTSPSLPVITCAQISDHFLQRTWITRHVNSNRRAIIYPSELVVWILTALQTRTASFWEYGREMSREGYVSICDGTWEQSQSWHNDACITKALIGTGWFPWARVAALAFSVCGWQGRKPGLGAQSIVKRKSMEP